MCVIVDSSVKEEILLLLAYFVPFMHSMLLYQRYTEEELRQVTTEERGIRKAVSNFSF